MLALIGIGLDIKDVSFKSLQYIKSADLVFIDKYTSIMDQEGIDFISKETGKKIVELKRSDFEENVKKTVAEAMSKNVALLIIGDPLVATTHHIILDEAHKQGVKTQIFHAPSVFTAAIGESGLDIYRFGPTTTVPFWTEKYKPTSFLDVISNNLKNSQHTLVLFDIEQKKSLPMTIEQASEIIENAQSKTRLIPDNKMVLIIGDVGKAAQTVIYSPISDISKFKSKLQGKTMSLIVPAQLNFAEEESAKRFTN